MTHASPRLILLLILFFTGCSATTTTHMTTTPPDLDTRYQRISNNIGDTRYGPGGQVILRVAYEALLQKHAAGEGNLVGLEDLWAHALQEGFILFNDPDKRWGRTTAEETADMIGQTTIGPWQITVRNIRETYGPPYGIQPDWTPAQVNDFCRDHPDVQAMMIIDYIQRSYEQLGQRSPYAIQRYFWLEPYVTGEIGQSHDWTRSVLAKPPPGGTWQDLTPEMKADTGFYAKQILMGTPYTDTGLLYWLYTTGDTEGAKQALRTWRDQKRLRVIDQDDTLDTRTLEGTHYTLTEHPGNFTIQPRDVRYYADEPETQTAIRQLIAEVALETPPDASRFEIVQGGIVRGDPTQPALALIFTAGEHGDGSQHILDTLKNRNVPAGFFVTGDYTAITEHHPFLRRMVDEGHYLGPHSHAHLLYAPWDDRSTSLVTREQFTHDLNRNIEDLQAFGGAAGQPIFFIPPYEWYNQQHADWADDMGLRLFNFTIGTGSHRDWMPESHPRFRSSDQMLDDILTHEAESPTGLNGHLLLLHLGGQREDKMYRHLGTLIDELRRRGYTFRRVDQLLGPASR
ncbi:polysaccharide deacetylase family protein [Mucisphaera calidilacus]|uniref:Peptidoglycan-N-acetylmuramic acid deacetylase PdaA n=1 Tax=Mucisphaera calidilacus TaxID=2527982 RepID=A0A518BVW2_9BACT|nr:polysaccharide deacetylase family protein [Mucisphaera calidilacus]QDU71122.1 Peptidoglycan-N-acetylmuramic acid deacetylase PdaA precursor [Mucisphaera calidilacus]